ncbi:MAG: protoporphyrinogen oxidase [Isosphaeraceae bacterium]
MKVGSSASGVFDSEVQSREQSARVVVIGGGISGLAAAHRLIETGPGVVPVVLEATDRPGGVLTTERRDGFLIDGSADSFITTFPWAIDLCRRIGLGDELIGTSPQGRRAFVVHKGRLEPIPDGLLIMAPTRIGPMLRTPILSVLGKLRMGCELFVPRGGGADESLASFATRRFGREAFDRLIQPLVSGMYTGDPSRLSVRATLPRFLEMEQSRGSLIRAMRSGQTMQGSGGKSGESSGSGARYGLFVGLRDGMQQLVDGLVACLPAGSIRCGTRVEELRRKPDGRWEVAIDGPDPGVIEADGVILATPSQVAAALVRKSDPTLAGMLDGITSTGCAVVSLGYRREQIGHALDGFGFVVPIKENLPILSASFASVKFEGRAPAGHVLIRVFVGGVKRPELLDADDATLQEIAIRELARLIDARGTPVLRHVNRWREVMPQYEVGHLDRVDAIEERVRSNGRLALAGNAYRGVGVPQCVRSGEQAADQILTQLRPSATPG